MLTAVVTRRGSQLEVVFLSTTEHGGEEEYVAEHCEFPEKNAEGEVITTAEGKEVCEEGPSPIAPEIKELAWGAGSFVVFALLMRFFLYPRLKKGMEARYGAIRDRHEQADTARAAARAEVAEYESALATVKAEANERVEAARQVLEAERAARLAEVNAGIAARREAAAERTRAAREAARADVAAAVADVTSRTVELTLGRQPDPATVRAAVDEAMSAGVSS